MPRHGSHRASSLPRTLGSTLLGAVIPGAGFVAAGRVRLGIAVMSLAAGLLGLGLYAGLARRDDAVALAVNPRGLLVVTGVLLVLGSCWIAVVVATYRMLRPASAPTGQRVAGSIVVGLICFAIAGPTAVGARTALTSRDLVSSVFASEGKSRSATRVKVDKKDPWAKIPRLNLLLLGADDGAGREGTRTDTVMVASIDTRTGDTKLISLSRNWMRMPFPEDSPLHDKYPNGFVDESVPDDKEQPEFYLDAMYRNLPERYPNILGPSDNLGADVLKLSVGEAVGLKIHYYLQVNLAGFERIVDALGGITVNVNYRVPVGGDDNLTPRDTSDDTLPSRYIEPGRDKHLGGFDALWFARGRYRVAGSDHARQIRQRCTIEAIARSADPKTLVTKYQAIAKASKKLLRTDIPQELLPAFVELGLKVKKAGLSPITVTDELRYGHPDFEALRATVRKSFTKTPAKAPTKAPAKRPTKPVADECGYHPS